MNLHPFPRTSAALSIAREELSLALKIIGIVIQIVTMVYCGIMMYLSIHDVIRLVIYSAMLVLTLALFIVGFALGKRKGEWKEEAKIREKRKRRASLILKLVNYVLRLALITLGTVDIIMGQGSYVAVFSTIISGVLFFLGLIVEIVIRLFYHYLDFITFAATRDFEEHKIVSGIAKAKNNPYSVMENITGFLAGNSKEEPKRTAHQEALDQKLMDTYASNKDAKREQKALKKAENQKQKEASKAKIKENLGKIKERFRHKKD